MAARAGATRKFIKPLGALAAAVSLALWLLLPSSLLPAAAIASREHPRPGGSGPASKGQAAEGSAPSGAVTVVPPPAPADAPRKHHARGGAVTLGPAASGNQAAATGSEAGAKGESCCTRRPRRHDRGETAGGGSTGRRPAHHTEGPLASAPAAPALAGEAAGPAARRKTRGKEKHPKPKPSKEPRQKRSAPQPAPTEAAPPLSSASSAVAPVAVATSPTTTTPMPALTLPAASAVRAQPAASAPRRRQARRGSPRRRAAASPQAVAPVRASAQAGAATLRSAHANARRTVPRAVAPRSQSPLVTTVTRIIDVVPPLVRLALGALLALALALGANSRLASRRARRLSRQRSELLDDVGLLQAALLPALPDRLGPVGTSAAYRPASGPGAGGDFYDVFALGDGQLGVIVGDLSGHGREALPHTTLVRFTLRAYLEAGLSPRSALQTAAAVLERQLGGSFATVLAATYHPRDRTLIYACAGHPPPVVIGGESIAPITVCSSPPIGVGQPTGMRQTIVSLPGRSLACFYTDGVIEARVADELFGAARLAQMVAELAPEATATTLLDRVAAECDRSPDDMAACLLRVEGDSCAPRVQVEELELDCRESARDRAARFLIAAGLEPGEVDDAVSTVRGAVARHGSVILELHLGDGSPEVVLRQRNVAVLRPRARDAERLAGVSR